MHTHDLLVVCMQSVLGLCLIWLLVRHTGCTSRGWSAVRMRRTCCDARWARACASSTGAWPPPQASPRSVSPPASPAPPSSAACSRCLHPACSLHLLDLCSSCAPRLMLSTVLIAHPSRGHTLAGACFGYGCCRSHNLVVCIHSRSAFVSYFMLNNGVVILPSWAWADLCCQ